MSSKDIGYKKSKMKLGILHERIRKDEKLIIKKAEEKGIDVVLINDKDLIFRLEKNKIFGI